MFTLRCHKLPQGRQKSGATMGKWSATMGKWSAIIGKWSATAGSGAQPREVSPASGTYRRADGTRGTRNSGPGSGARPHAGGGRRETAGKDTITSKLSGTVR